MVRPLAGAPRLATARFARITLLALGASLATVQLAAARELRITVSPGAPTWQDPIEVTVTGHVVTSCGPHIVSLQNPRLTHPSFLDVDLVEAPCDVLAPPQSYPFSVSATFDRQLPGMYTLRVHDLPGGDTSTLPLEVFEVGGVQLTLPTTARSDQPVSFVVSGWGSCPGFDSVEVDGNVIWAQVSADCAILPPGAAVFDIEHDLGVLPPGDYEVRVIDFVTRPWHPFYRPLVRGSFRVWDAAGCVPSATTLCLHGGRFRVAATWHAFDDSTGAAHAAPLPGNETSGLLWFFAPDNAELTVKVLDGCGYNDRWWVFVSPGSTVAYELVVTDTATGAERRYRNDLGVVPELLADTAAFDCH